MTHKTDSFDDKIKVIDKYYKDDELFLKVYFENYNTFHIYIRVDYEKSSQVYKLRWFDLDRVKTSEIGKYESSEYLEEATVEYIKFVVEGIKVPSEMKCGEDNNVSLYIDCKCQNKDKLDIRFYRYLPDEMQELVKVFEVLFMSLPKKIYSFYEDVSGRDALEYQYDQTFRFNLYADDLGLLYDIDSRKIAEKFWKEDKILFLEKVGNRFFSVIEENTLSCVVIKYDEKTHDMRVHCSCPMPDFCKHIYAVIKAIRANKFISFYKVVPMTKMKEISSQTGSFSNLLSIGVDGDRLGIISDDGEIIYSDVLDTKGKLLWKIIEDDTDNGLTEAIEELKNM